MVIKALTLFILQMAIQCQNNSKCRHVINKDQKFVFQQSQNAIILQSNKENLESITDLGYEILKLDFLIKFEENMEIISVTKSQNFKILKVESHHIMLQEYCFLLQPSNINTCNYLIGCTFINNANQNKKYQLNFNTIEQNYSIITDQIESCSDIIYNSEKQLIVFCHNQQYFKFYQLGVISNSNSSQFYQQLQKQNDCQIKLQQTDTMIFVNYLRCEQWTIYYMDQNFNISLYKKNIQALDKIINFGQLINVQTCYNQVYFIFRYVYIMQKFKNLLIQEELGELSIRENESIEFLIFIKCQPNWAVISSNNHIFAFQNEERILLGTIPKSIYQLNEIVLITLENQLVAYITKNIQKIYQLNFTKLDKFSESNQLYLINQKNLEVQFVTLQLEQYLKLEQKYFYEIINQNIFCSGIIIYCLEIFEMAVQNQIQLPVTQISNNCEMQEINFLKDMEIFVSHPFKIQDKEYILQNKTIVLNLFDKTELTKHCQSKYLQDKNAQVLDINIEEQKLIILVNQTIHLVDFMDNEIMKEIDITGKQVINSLSYIIIYTSEIKELNIKSWFGSFFPFRFVEGFIQQINIFSEKLIVKVKESDFLYVVNYKQITNYSISYQQFDQQHFSTSNIKFFYQIEEITIIQYDQFVEVVQKSGKWLHNIQDIQLFEASKLTSGILLMGLHDFEQILKVYFIDKNKLIEIQSISEYNKTFVRPINYKQRNLKFAILAKQKENYVVLFYRFEKNFLKLRQIIQTQKSTFFLTQSNLIYYNLNNSIEILNLDKFQLNIKFENFIQANFIQNFEVQINFISQQNAELVLSGKLDIHIINICPHIFSKKQFLNINYDLNTAINHNILLKINPMQQFYGQILNFHIESQDITIEGPFIFETRIQKCRFTKSLQCLNVTSINYQNQVINLYETFIDGKQLEFAMMNDSPSPFKLFNSTFILFMHNQIELIAIIFEKQIQSKNYTIIQVLRLHNSKKNLVIEQEQIHIEVQNQMFLVLQNNQFLTLLYHDGEKIIEIKVKENILDAIIVENCLDMVLFLYYQNSTDILELVGQHIFNKNILLRKSINLQLFDFDIEIPNIGQKQYDLVSAKQNEQILELSLIYFTQIITRFIYFKINMTDLEFAFKIEKNIRMPQNLDEFFYTYYLFHHHFIVQISRTDYLYYNLSEEQDLYDPFKVIQYFNLNLIQRFNSTHFLFKCSGLIIIGRIEFQLTLHKMNSTMKKTNLIASNEVSNASIEITFEKIEQDISIPVENNQHKPHFIIFVGFFAICLFFFFFRRKKLQLRIKQDE